MANLFIVGHFSEHYRASSILALPTEGKWYPPIMWQPKQKASQITNTIPKDAEALMEKHCHGWNMPSDPSFYPHLQQHHLLSLAALEKGRGLFWIGLGWKEFLI